MKKYVRTERGERIDQPDFQAVAEIAHRDALDGVVDTLLVGEDNVDTQTQPRMFVLNGFACTNPSGTLLNVTGGKAILAFRDTNGEIRYGAVLSEGDTDKTLDTATLTSGTYGVYVRFTLQDTDVQNRLFWNAFSTTPAEFQRAIATRRTENWDVVIEKLSPGDDWLKIANIILPISPGNITDLRNLFFEGQAANSYKVVDAEWGGGNDRSALRAANGVFGFYKAIRGLQRQVQDIVSTTSAGWWTDLATAGARSLRNLTVEKLNRDGTDSITGSILPDSSGLHSLGSSVKRFAQIFSNYFVGSVAQLGDLNLASAAANSIARITANYSSSYRTLLFQSRDDSINPSSRTMMRVYRYNASVQNPNGLEVTFNAVWNPVTSKWNRDEAGYDAIKYEIGDINICGLVHDQLGSNIWDDTQTAGNWDATPWLLSTSGGITITGTLTAGISMQTPQLTASASVITPQLTAGTGYFSTHARVVGYNGVSAPTVNTIYAENIVKAWAVFNTSGGTPVIWSEFNILSISTVGAPAFCLRVIMRTPIASNYAPVLSLATANNVWCSTAIVNSTTFDIHAWDPIGIFNIQSNDVKIAFQVIGTQ